MSAHTSPGTATGGTGRAGRREWIGLAVLVLPTLLLSIDVSVLHLALPQLSADLRPSSVQQLWIMDIYGFMIAGFLVTMGTLGDRIGRRRLLMVGAAAFGAASVVAAFSTSAEMLIATRAVMGIAGATVMPSTLALISTMFRDPKQRGFAIAVFMSCFMGGVTLGPVVGGAVLEAFWWGAAFLLGVPPMLLLLVTAHLVLPEHQDSGAGRVDLASVALSLLAILTVIYGLKELARDGLGPVAIASILAGLAVGTVFVRRQRALTDPLIDLSLFTERTFATLISIMLVTGITMGGLSMMSNLYLQMVGEHSPLHAGLWMVPGGVAMIGTTLLVPGVAHRFRPGLVIAAGLLLSAVGMAVLTQIGSDSSTLTLVFGSVLMSIGVAPSVAMGTDMAVGAVRPERAGSAAAITESGAEFGIALGIAVMGSVSTFAYHGSIAGAAFPGLPDAAVGAARESIAGAAAAAERLPAAQAAELLAPAQAAFTAGLNAAALLGVVLTVVLATTTAVRLRHLPAAANAPGRDAAEGSAAVETVEDAEADTGVPVTAAGLSAEAGVRIT